MPISGHDGLHGLGAAFDRLPDAVTDNDFLEWQERQAGLIGSALHALLAQLDTQYDDPMDSPAFVQHAHGTTTRLENRYPSAFSPSAGPGSARAVVRELEEVERKAREAMRP